MLSLSKIFHFEMAHAIYGYSGACKDIHGHSYELHVSVCSDAEDTNYIPAPGLLIDFKDIKKLVTDLVVNRMDHHLLLSQEFLNNNKTISSAENMVIFDAEPTAENLIIYIRNLIKESLPDNIRLTHLKLYETKDSYVEWVGQ